MGLSDEIYEIVSQFDNWEADDPYREMADQITERILDRSLNQENKQLYNELATNFVSSYYQGIDRDSSIIAAVSGRVCGNKFKIRVEFIDDSKEEYTIPKVAVTCDLPFDTVFYLSKQKAFKYKYDEVVNG